MMTIQISEEHKGSGIFKATISGSEGVIRHLCKLMKSEWYRFNTTTYLGNEGAFCEYLISENQVESIKYDYNAIIGRAVIMLKKEQAKADRNYKDKCRRVLKSLED